MAQNPQIWFCRGIARQISPNGAARAIECKQGGRCVFSRVLCRNRSSRGTNVGTMFWGGLIKNCLGFIKHFCFLLALAGSGWLPLALAGSCWAWRALAEPGWPWLALAGAGWPWLSPAAGSGMRWLALAASEWLAGWHWVALAGRGWLWPALALAGSGWLWLDGFGLLGGQGLSLTTNRPIGGSGVPTQPPIASAPEGDQRQPGPARAPQT